jgi:hypothetical protein
MDCNRPKLPTRRFSPRGLRAVWNFCSLDGLRTSKGIRSAVGHTWYIGNELVTRLLRDGFSPTWRHAHLTIGRIPTDDTEWHVKNRLAMHAHKLYSLWLLLQLPTSCRRKLLEILRLHVRGSKNVALICPKLDDRGLEGEYISAEMTGDVTLAVITSEQGDQQGGTWRWRGVVSWDEMVPLPSFQARGIIIQ